MAVLGTRARSSNSSVDTLPNAPNISGVTYWNRCARSVIVSSRSRLLFSCSSSVMRCVSSAIRAADSPSGLAPRALWDSLSWGPVGPAPAPPWAQAWKARALSRPVMGRMERFTSSSTNSPRSRDADMKALNSRVISWRLLA